MAKSFRFPRWVEKTRTYSIHPVAFIDQPVATPHQPRYAQQLPPGGSQGGCAARVARLATPTMAVLRRERFVPPPPVWRAVSSPGGLRKQRIDIGFVRHYPAAAPLGSPSWRPLRNSKNFWLTATNVLHPLSQTCRFRSAAKSDSFLIVE